MSMINEKNDIINDTPKKTDDMVSYRKEYYKNNKEKIKENSKIRIKCDICNCEVIKQQLRRHQRSKRHLNNLNMSNKSIDTDNSNSNSNFINKDDYKCEGDRIHCCICNCTFFKNNLKIHFKSKKHMLHKKIKDLEKL